MDISVKSKLILMQWGIACKGDVNDEKKFCSMDTDKSGEKTSTILKQAIRAINGFFPRLLWSSFIFPSLLMIISTAVRFILFSSKQLTSILYYVAIFKRSKEIVTFLLRGTNS